MPPPNPEHYHTEDLGEAAYLRTQGFPLLGLARREGWRLAFAFPPAACPAAATYYDGALINARAYFYTLKELKGALVQAKRRQGDYGHGTRRPA